MQHLIIREGKNNTRNILDSTLALMEANCSPKHQPLPDLRSCPQPYFIQSSFIFSLSPDGDEPIIATGCPVIRIDTPRDVVITSPPVYHQTISQSYKLIFHWGKFWRIDSRPFLIYLPFLDCRKLFKVLSCK